MAIAVAQQPRTEVQATEVLHQEVQEGIALQLELHHEQIVIAGLIEVQDTAVLEAGLQAEAQDTAVLEADLQAEAQDIEVQVEVLEAQGAIGVRADQVDRLVEDHLAEEAVDDDTKSEPFYSNQKYIQ